MDAAVRIALCAVVAVLTPQAETRAEACHVDTMGVLGVTWSGRRALVEVGVNGKPTHALVDTGAASTAFFRDGAKALGLALRAGPFTFVGVNGEVQGYSAHVGEITLGRWRTPNVDLFVIGSDAGGDEGMALILGQDVLSAGDVEFDLANDRIRLFKPLGDCEHTSFAYWATESGAQAMDVEIARRRHDHNYLKVEVALNGKTVKALLDTGAPFSIVTRTAATRAGVTAGGPNTAPLGASQGIANRDFETWIATFDTFVLGGETVRNARIRIGDVEGLGVPDADMLLGMDFFRAHHIYVSYERERMYFTYNGGRIFDITSPPESNPLARPPALAAPAGQ